MMSNCSTTQECFSEFKLVYQSSGPILPRRSTWKIKFGDSVCHLDLGLVGMEYLHAILTYEPAPEFTGAVTKAYEGELAESFSPADDTESDRHAWEARESNNVGYGIECRPDAVLALPPSTVKRLIAQWNIEAKAALDAGNRLRYDELMLDVNRGQQYLREGTAHGGRSRRFTDRVSRDRSAERMAINYAITAIRKQAPTIADHLRETIVMSGGQWMYTGTHLWETETEYPADFIGTNQPDDECVPDWTFTPRVESTEVLAIRLAWGISSSKRDKVLATIVAYRERTGIMKEDRDANFEGKLKQLEEKVGVRDVASKELTPTERVAELLRRNKERYAGRDRDFIFEQTRQDIREFYSQPTRDSKWYWLDRVPLRNADARNSFHS